MAGELPQAVTELALRLADDVDARLRMSLAKDVPWINAQCRPVMTIN
jgi:hypothetical protein